MKKQFFMYGILVSHQAYLEMETAPTIEDVLKGDNGIQGIFTGRNGEFMIIGTVLEYVKDSYTQACIVPELLSAEESLIRVTISERYNIAGEFHYYFIKK